MTGIIYKTVRETYYLAPETRISYGIAAYSDAEIDGTASVIVSAHDICSDKDRIDDLVRLCNRHHLAPEHLYDIVEDFLAS